MVTTDGSMAQAGRRTAELGAEYDAAHAQDAERHAVERLFAGPGEMRALCRAKDWSATLLGPVHRWSRSLRTVVATVLEAPTAMIVLWGPDAVQVYNDGYRAVMGAKHPMGLGIPNGECWPEVWEFNRPIIEGVMQRGERFVFTDQRLELARDGAPTEAFFTLTFSAVPDDDDSIGGTLATVFETTTQVQARNAHEEALRVSEARYRALFERMGDGFCVIEVLFDEDDRPYDVRFLEANPAFAQQTGLTDVIGRTMRELAPALESHWFERYGRVARTGEPARFDAPAEALGRWYEVDAFRIGEPAEHRVAVLFEDVSERRRGAQEQERLLIALQLERARLFQVFQRAPSFIVAFRGGADLVYDFVNEAYYQLIGHRDVLGKPLLEAIPEIRGQGFDELLNHVRESGEPWVGRESPVELQRTPNGPLETRYLDMVFQALTEPDGARTGVLAHGSDITDQVLARREIERLLRASESALSEAESARGEAEAANRAKSEFLAVMSHELRTPLNAIGGYAELLEMGIRGPVTPLQAEDLRRIQTSQRHLLGLINEVLNYAKLETGTVHYEVADVRVRDALAAAEGLIAPQARARGIALSVAQCAADLEMRADADKVRQILVNLLSNAVKFTERGGRVDLRCNPDEREVRIAVRDTGIGIPSDKLEIIFEPFVQVRADLTRTHEGTGLGLAISRDLARGMGGDLVVESTLGEGSMFTLVLPRRSTVVAAS